MCECVKRKRDCVSVGCVINDQEMIRAKRTVGRDELLMELEKYACFL